MVMQILTEGNPGNIIFLLANANKIPLILDGNITVSKLPINRLDTSEYDVVFTCCVCLITMFTMFWFSRYRNSARGVERNFLQFL